MTMRSMYGILQVVPDQRDIWEFETHWAKSIGDVRFHIKLES